MPTSPVGKGPHYENIRRARRYNCPHFEAAMLKMLDALLYGEIDFKQDGTEHPDYEDMVKRMKQLRQFIDKQKAKENA